MKTIYIMLMNVGLIALFFFTNTSWTSPYESIQIMLLETVIVGIPTTILALQPNHAIIKGNFMGNVLRRCLPASLTFILMTVSLYLVKNLVFLDMTNSQLSTIIAISYTYGGFFALFFAMKPFNSWKKLMYVCIGVIVTMAIVLLQSLFNYSVLPREQILLLLVVVLASPALMYANMYLFRYTDLPKKKLKLKRG
jgi:cation-transporting ATPase E